MQGRSLRLLVRQWVITTGLVLAATSVTDAQSERQEVLVLYSTRAAAQFSIVGERELRETFGAGLGPSLDYYSEFMDLTMFSERTDSAFRDFLLIKYQNVRFDLIVAMQDRAIEFVTSYQDILFRDTPVVFLTNNPAIVPPPNSTGLIHERNFAATVTFIRQLQPDIRQIFVVTGAPSGDRAYESALRRQVQQSDSALTFTYLTGLPTNDLENRLSKLPPQSAVYYLSVGRDGAGQVFHPLEYVDRVVAAANAPTYSWVDSMMGHGIVGGSLYSQGAAIGRVGHLALRVLGGEPAQSIPVTALNINENQVDWRRLGRWRIDEARLPAGTVVRFRDPTLWERYRTYILAGFAILITQMVLITGLLIQRERRRRAEKELRGREAELRRSHERNRHLGTRLMQAQETERARIARELHDDICQRMLLLTIELESWNRANPGEASAAEALKDAKDISTSLHELSHQLHPTKLRLIGLVAALDRLCLEVSRSGVAIEYTHDNVPSALPPDLMLCLFRVVQEALQNVVKYGHAKLVSVDLRGSADGLTLTIIDDGVGFNLDAAWGKGVGLVSMVERLDAIGGTLDVYSSPGAGTCLTATLPAYVVEASLVRA